MKLALLLILASVACTGCVTMTPRAGQIMLHSQMSTLLDKCKKLGPVSAEASAWTQIDYASVDQQAKNNLRDKAAEIYGAEVDSVVVINVDRYGTKSVASGVAFKCF
jgi:hypothetical protein